MITKQTKQAIIEKGFFDFLAQDGHLYEKAEIITLAKEYSYAVYEQARSIDKEAANVGMWEQIDLEESDDDYIEPERESRAGIATKEYSRAGLKIQR